MARSPTVLLTGATGFVGGAAALELLQHRSDCRLLCLVRGEAPEQRLRQSLLRFQPPAGIADRCEVVRGDITDTASLNDPRLDAVTHVLHLAANTSFLSVRSVRHTNTVPLAALRAGAPYLAGLNLPADAPPAFLLDCRRAGPVIRPNPGAFDNRWKVFPQDFPSAAHLLDRGVRRARLVQHGSPVARDDLAHVLRRWQDGGVALEGIDPAGNAAPVAINVREPAWYRSVWQRVIELFGLRRVPQGGFGSAVPEPSRGG